MRAIRMREHGGAEVLRFDDVADPEPASGEAVVRVEAAGVNFIDVYHRTGLYPLELPAVPGVEAAGVVVAVGAGADEVSVGDRVGWVMVPGAYAELAAVPTERLLPLPDGCDVRTAAAVLLQGMTAHYLTRSTVRIGADDTVLVHAGAGGVGRLLIQMARRLGARVLSTVSTAEKAELARRAGADLVIRYGEEDFAAAVREATDGAGVSVVYDSVGATTFDASLSCCRARGTLVLFGQSSGPVPAFDPARLGGQGSVYLTRPSLADYAADRDERRWRAREVLGAVGDGSLRVDVFRALPLAEAAEAHRQLEGRATHGKLLLVP